MGGAILPTVIGVGASLFGSRRASRAAKRALQQQEAQFQKAQERLAPYEETGRLANEMLRSDLETGRLGGEFTRPDFENDPGYQFRLQQGERALGRAQSARGNLYSGAAIDESLKLNQNLAEQAYNDAFNRWMQTQQNRQGLLTGQQNLGVGTAGGMGNYDTAIGQSRAEAGLARENYRQQGLSNAIGAIMPSGGTGGFGAALGGGGQAAMMNPDILQSFLY